MLDERHRVQTKLLRRGCALTALLLKIHIAILPGYTRCFISIVDPAHRPRRVLVNSYATRELILGQLIVINIEKLTGFFLVLFGIPMDIIQIHHSNSNVIKPVQNLKIFINGII